MSACGPSRRDCDGQALVTPESHAGAYASSPGAGWTAPVTEVPPPPPPSVTLEFLRLGLTARVQVKLLQTDRLTSLRPQLGQWALLGWLPFGSQLVSSSNGKPASYNIAKNTLWRQEGAADRGDQEGWDPGPCQQRVGAGQVLGGVKDKKGAAKKSGSLLVYF